MAYCRDIDREGFLTVQTQYFVQGLVVEGGKTAYQVSEEIDIPQTTISRWVRQAKENESAPTLKASEKSELQRLRRENARLKQERDFLRDAAAYFARDQD